MSEIFTLEKVWEAYLDCRKRKKNKINALKFEVNREKNLVALYKELKSHKYEISKHICFIVVDPTVREVFAADFRDRIVHHLLCNELRDIFEPEFIANSFANRTGKGTHRGVEKVKEYLRAVDKDSYCLKMDIKSFFRSIDKDILFQLISEKVSNTSKTGWWKSEVLWLCRKIIYHDPTKNYAFKGNEKLRTLVPPEKSLFSSRGKGLPIGNLTSQFFANIYLDQLDKFISDNHFHYVRYVDDFIILGGQELIKELPEIRQFLKGQLNLELSDKKTKFQRIDKGIDFLGYFIKPHYVLVRKKIVIRFKQKIRQGGCSFETVNSYFGHFKHADSYSLRRKIYRKYLKNNFVVKGDYSSVKNYD